MPVPVVSAGFVISLLVLFMIFVENVGGTEDHNEITLTILFNEIVTRPNAGKLLIDKALETLRNETDSKINVNYLEFKSNNSTRDEISRVLSNQTPIDIITLDQIWLGEFAQKGLLTDLTNYTEQLWDRNGDEEWYFQNWEGGKYQSGIYGIWAWTDVRGIWYWKDLLQKAGVDPNLLKTWDGYIEASKRLNRVLRPEGIEGTHLVGAVHSPDMWYPYLWMLGGEILQQKDGHPTKNVYWFPAFNSSEGVRAMEFIKLQVDSGIRPQKIHFWGNEFLDRKFAVMIEGSWMPTRAQSKIQNSIPSQNFEERVGFLPMFPVPNEGDQTSTLMGGWEFAIPTASHHKDLAWKLITLILEPDILAPWLVEHRLLPTQVTIGEGESRFNASYSYPYYDEMISAIPFGGARPNIPEYSQIAHYINEAINAVYNGTMDPKEALNDAASKSALISGW
ncbi:MAG TPA: extracellular solute-binding protein [Nitrososphaeraceae archaeon]|nr:extracellular solute-binding protein [Nitrososphaeraceae archaeon]